MTLVFGFFAIRVQIDASILGSLNDGDPQVLKLKEVRREFPSSGTMALLIQGDDTAELRRAAKEAAGVLQALPEVTAATERYDPQFLISRGLLMLADGQFEQLGRQLKRIQVSLDAAQGEADLGLSALIESQKIPSPFRSPLQSAAGFTAQLELLAGQGIDVFPPALGGLTLDDGWIVSRDGRIYLVELRTSLDPIFDDIGAAGFAPFEAAVAPLRVSYPTLQFSFAGMSAVAAQDQASVLNRILPLSSISLVLILLLLWHLNRSFTAMFSVGVSLMVALVWTGGLVYLVIGYASIMALGFAVLLFGLGVDHAAHLLLRMNEERLAGASDEEALTAAWVHAGRGVVVGGGTTALAFACMGLIDFKAAVHLGLTAAMGTVCALFLMMTMLPALLSLTAQFRRPPRAPRVVPILSSMVRWSLSHRNLVLAMTALLTVLGAHQCNSFELETDLEQVMTSDLPAMAANRLLKTEFDISTEAVFSTAPTLEALRERAAQLEALPEVARVEGLHTVIPPDASERALRNQSLLPLLEGLEIAIPASLDETSYRASLKRTRALVDRWPKTTKWQELRSRCLTALSLLRGQTGAARIDQLSQTITSLQTAIRSETGAESALPQSLVERFHGSDQYLALVYPSDDRLDATALSQFRHAVQSIDAKAAGGLFVVDYLLVGGMGRMRLALIAIICVLGLILIVDLRRPVLVVVALVPVICGSFISLGAVMALGQPMTLVMLSAFPLIFGIGIDDGVHILHRYREGGGDIQSATAQVGQAILFTSLSTGVSFAVLLGLNHNGFQGLAMLVILGVWGCFFTSVMVIPCLMTLLGETNGQS